MRATVHVRNMATKPLLIGQIGFFGGLLLCFAIKPQYLRSEGGFSNYGTTASTIAFFTFAFLSATIGTFITANQIAKLHSRLAWTLRVLALLFFLVLISTYPYKLNDFYDAAHKDVSIVLSLWGLGLGAWFVFKRHDIWNAASYALQLAATTAGIATILGYVHLLFVSQFVAGGAFGALLVRATSQIVGEKL